AKSLQITLQNSPNSTNNPLTSSRIFTKNAAAGCLMTVGSTCNLSTPTPLFKTLRATSGYKLTIIGYSGLNATGSQVSQAIKDNFSLASTSSLCGSFPACTLTLTMNVIFPTGQLIFP